MPPWRKSFFPHCLTRLLLRRSTEPRSEMTSLNRQISGMPLILPGGGVEQGKDRDKEVLRSAKITGTG